MRPLGEVSIALARAASTPGTVVQLAHRAQVGVQVARYTASRMVERQQLVVLEPGRPAVLAAPEALPPGAKVQRAAAPDASEQVARTLDWLARSFWEIDPGAPP